MSVPGLNIPISVLTDAYKYTHFLLYPEGMVEATIYGEPRSAYDKDPCDERIVFYGIRYAIENYVAQRWTMETVEKTERFLSTFNVGRTPYPFPKELFESFVRENHGRFPVVIESLPEGSVIYPHVPVYQITAEGKYAPLAPWLETLMTLLIWYPITVATLSRKCKQHITDAFDLANVPEELRFLLNSRLHDFGFRGTSSVETSVIGGVAHLLSFDGTDTMSAAYYAQFNLNNGKPVACSIPATEHSVMTAHKRRHDGLENGGVANELEALQQLVGVYGKNDVDICACVGDSYNLLNFLRFLVSMIDATKKGTLVVRPDSGEPRKVVLYSLILLEIMLSQKTNTFYDDPLHRVGKDGIKRIMFTGYAVIQGDGINRNSMKMILNDLMNPKIREECIKELFEGANCGFDRGQLFDETIRDNLLSKHIAYSPANLAFGMGGGLLQKVDRDVTNFATKLSYVVIEKEDGVRTERAVMKDPITDQNKKSLPGKLGVKRVDGKPTTFPKHLVKRKDNLLQVVYNGYKKHPIPKTAFTEDLDTIRQRVETEWKAAPLKHNAVSAELKALQDALHAEQ
jgi:nicotinamide phosphoribosyltransferase